MFGQQGLGGEQLEFLVEGKPIGAAMTGGDGRAFLEYTPRLRGNKEVKVRLAGSKRVEGSDATAILACWERRRPILLVESVALAEPTPTPRLPLPALPALPLEFGAQDHPKPAPDSAEVLQRLGEFFYNLIYLSRSERDAMTEIEELRAWLRDHRFPPGLTMTVRPGESALADKIEELRAQGWDNLKAGIGRTREFAEVLVDHRMEVVILPASSKDQNLPRKAKVVENWKDVRKKL